MGLTATRALTPKIVNYRFRASSRVFSAISWARREYVAFSERFLKPLRILVVSYTFPPQAEVGSIRIAQFCRYLPECGIEPTVLSVEEQFYESVDHSRTLPGSLRVLRTPRNSNPLEWYRSLKQIIKASPSRETHSKGSEGGETQGGYYWLRGNLNALLEVPDRYWGWYWPAVRRADQFFRQQRVDAVFSSGPPWTSHLVARHLKRKFGVVWLADFRDPWASAKSVRRRPAWWHQLASRLEKSCVQMADRVLCNTDRLREAYQLQYPDLDLAKFRTLTNGFEDLPVPRSDKINARRQFVHLGSLYGHRRIDTFLIALNTLVRSGRLDPASFRVIFQGDMEPSHLAQAVKIAPDLLQCDCLEFLPRTSWQQAWNLLWQSDLLLLFQGSHELQVPAKFYEYLQTGIPMFAVAEEGALTDVLRATAAGIWVGPANPLDIADALLEALHLPHRSAEDVSRRLAGQYHYRSLTKKLSLLIQEVVTGF